MSSLCLSPLAQASTDAEKPLILVHEADEAKGGATLAAVREECLVETAERPDIYEHLFGGSWTVTTWVRLRAFQLVSLRLIAEQVLRHSLDYKEVRAPSHECVSECVAGV